VYNLRTEKGGLALDKLLAVLDEEAAMTDVEGRWPERSIRGLQDAGLLGLTLPAEAGGRGASMRQFAEVAEQIAAHCASTAMIYLMHVCGAQAVAASGSARCSDVMKDITANGALATLAFSERGSRSHFWAPVSRASRNSRDVILNCDKSFVTSAGRADYYVVSSLAIDGKAALDSTLYLVHKKAAGMQCKGAWNGLGLRGNSSGPMVFRDCHIEEASRLTPEGAGFKAMMEIVLPWFQIGSAAVSIGISEAAFAAAVGHASSAKFEHLGDTIAAALPTVRARLARMRLDIDSARAYLDSTLTRIEKGSADAMLFVLGCKALAAETALNVTDEAMRVCGGAAFGKTLSIERNFRDARASSIMAPTTDLLYDFIGKAVAGLPLF
jgi:alkylation response protein AidB-like acyl-CoA dehydrogenase